MGNTREYCLKVPTPLESPSLKDPVASYPSGCSVTPGKMYTSRASWKDNLKSNSRNTFRWTACPWGMFYSPSTSCFLELGSLFRGRPYNICKKQPGPRPCIMHRLSCYPDPCADPKSRSILALCTLIHRSTRLQTCGHVCLWDLSWVLAVAANEALHKLPREYQAA